MCLDILPVYKPEYFTTLLLPNEIRSLRFILYNETYTKLEAYNETFNQIRSEFNEGNM